MNLGDVNLLQSPGYGSKQWPVVIVQSDRYKYDVEKDGSGFVVASVKKRVLVDPSTIR
jgi:hypothetical protein